VSTVSAVLAANQRFYEAFSARDAGAMARLWARDHAIACVHPGWEALHGRESVLASFRAILGDPNAPKVQATGEHVIVLGDAAFVTCTEHILGTALVATNVLALEGGEWKMVHHHASPLAEERAARRAVDKALN
jgi:ketosteroid isomerase-like protein